MTKKKWLEDETMQFINLYESHEVLWNTSITEYRNKHARQLALEKIYKEMTIKNFGVNGTKAKMNTVKLLNSEPSELSAIERCPLFRKVNKNYVCTYL
jgi:hypothetical protein